MPRKMLIALKLVSRLQRCMQWDAYVTFLINTMTSRLCFENDNEISHITIQMFSARDSLCSWRYCVIKVLAAEPRSKKRSGDEASGISRKSLSTSTQYRHHFCFWRKKFFLANQFLVIVCITFLQMHLDGNLTWTTINLKFKQFSQANKQGQTPLLRTWLLWLADFAIG